MLHVFSDNLCLLKTETISTGSELENIANS